MGQHGPRKKRARTQMFGKKGEFIMFHV